MKGFFKKIAEKIHGIFAKIIGADGVYYIGGNDILPPPLEPEEEAELISHLSADGDSVRQILIERNLRLVVYIARKFESSGVGTEDLVSIGAYKSGSNPKLDQALKQMDAINGFLTQGINESFSYEESLKQMAAIFRDNAGKSA